MSSSSISADSQPSKAEHQPLVLGVDGGGTKTLAWIARLDNQSKPRLLSRAETGSSNKVAIGLKPALDNLKLAIDQAFANGQLSPQPLASAVFALAGSGTETAKLQILKFINENYVIEHASVVHDGQAVLHAGTPEGRGVALIAGTGTVAFGENASGDSAVVGGWGYWFGDEGSAYWLGQSALRAISQAVDGRALPTHLTDAILSQLNITNPREILAALSLGGNTRLAIADLAATVCEIAQQQDKVACQLVSQAAEHGCQHITTLANQLFHDEPFALAIAGGVLCGSQYAREQLAAHLKSDRCCPTSVQLVNEPVEGCLKLACLQLEATG